MTHNQDLGADARSLLEAVTAISSDLDLASVLTRIVEAATALTGVVVGDAARVADQLRTLAPVEVTAAGNGA